MPLTKLVRVRRGGQITLPVEFRSKLKMDNRTLLRISLVNRELRISPVPVPAGKAGAAWAKELHALFASVRKESARNSKTEVDDAIDRAVTAVRRRRRARHA